MHGKSFIAADGIDTRHTKRPPIKCIFWRNLAVLYIVLGSIEHVEQLTIAADGYMTSLSAVPAAGQFEAIITGNERRS